jgi:hypothetical protein
MRTRQHLAVVADEIELKVRPLLRQAAPVDVEHVAVVVVLGQRVARSLPPWPEQIGALCDGRDVHPARVKQSDASDEGRSTT